MTFTIQNIIKSIALMLNGRWADIPVYASPNQQGTECPCFFVFQRPSSMTDGIDDINTRTINVDVVYVQARNIPNAYEDIYEKADGFDELFDMITYTDGAETTPLHTHDREYSIEDQELHYHFRLTNRVSIPKDEAQMQILEETNVEVNGTEI